MILDPERLISTRKSLGINKAEAAKMLNMSAMGYGRYESGQRSPSYQTICFIAQKFDTSPEYLCHETDSSFSDRIVIDKNNDQKLYDLIATIKKDKQLEDRLIAYYKSLSQTQRG